MEVTKSNFQELLSSIKIAIDECDFLAVDTELTGLYNSPSVEHAFDTMEEKYLKLREQCSNFLIIQFGLSTFKYHPEQKKFTHCDFNFYIFPQPQTGHTPDPIFLCQTSSLHFLASHGYDFNKTIYEGISSLTLNQESEIHESVSKKYKMERESVKHTPKTNFPRSFNVPREHKKFISSINKRVKAFISDESQTTMQLEPCSPYLRKLIYESVQSKHTSGIEMSSESVKNSNQKCITISKCTDQEKLDKLQLQEINELKDLDSAIGFRKVMEYMSASKKLVIGHCMYLDVFHIIEQFFPPLPEDLSEFKSKVHRIFPNLLDTKFMASSESLKPFLESTNLSEVLRQVQGKMFKFPAVEVAEGYKGYDLTAEQFHEAGYDALIAGLCYIAMANKLGEISTPRVEYVEPSSEILSPYVNRFYNLRHFDINGLNLCGPDPEPNRDNVFYASVPEECSRGDLEKLFLPYGDVYIHWLNDVSALVALKNVKNAVNAKATLLNNSIHGYCVRIYTDYQKWAMQQFKSRKIESKKLPASPKSKFSISETKNSGSTEGSFPCSAELVPENDESRAEIVDELPPEKRRKAIKEKNEREVSTAKVFEKENN